MVKVTRNQYDDIIREEYTFEAGIALALKKKHLEYSAKARGYKVSYSDNLTCVNVSNGENFCCTPCTETTMQNVNDCLEWVNQFDIIIEENA